jgi:hypothetical protein
MFVPYEREFKDETESYLGALITFSKLNMLKNEIIMSLKK